MGKLDGKIALITGATSGIGAATAKLFAQEGAEVILIGRDATRGQSIQNEIELSGGQAYFMECDISEENNVVALRHSFDRQFKKLDILFNNAGLLITSKLEEISSEDWHKIYAINTDAVMYMTKYFIDLVINTKGNILNNASIDGLQSNIRGRTTYLYATSKAATIQFTKLCALNYSDRIRVNCICPGVTETSLFTNRDFSRFNEAIPMGRIALPIEIAKAALFLVSDDASYISGAVLTVDGAASLK